MGTNYRRIIGLGLIVLILENSCVNSFSLELKNHQTPIASAKNYSDSRDEVYDLILMIHSAPGHFQRRTDARKCYSSLNHTMKFKYYFVVGKDPYMNLSIDKAVMNELHEHKDLLFLENHYDRYGRMATKTVVALTSIYKMFKSSRYVMKSDDDIFVDVRRILDLIEKNYLKERYYIGDVSTELYVNFERHHPNHEHAEVIHRAYFHPFNGGGGYIIDISKLDCLLKNAEKVEHYRNEDVFIGFLHFLCKIPPSNEPLLHAPTVVGFGDISCPLKTVVFHGLAGRIHKFSLFLEKFRITCKN